MEPDLSYQEVKAQLEKLKRNVAIDARAREGQMKRTRILEHERRQLEEEVSKRRKEHEIATKKIHDLQSALNSERSRRLDDLHKAFRISGNVALANKREKEMTDRYLSTQEQLDNKATLCHTFANAIEAHQQLTTNAVADLGIQDADIERLQAELLALKDALSEKCHQNYTLQQKIDAQSSLIAKLRASSNTDKPLHRHSKHQPSSLVLNQVARSHHIQQATHPYKSGERQDTKALLFETSNLPELRARLASHSSSPNFTVGAASIQYKEVHTSSSASSSVHTQAAWR